MAGMKFKELEVFPVVYAAVSNGTAFVTVEGGAKETYEAKKAAFAGMGVEFTGFEFGQRGGFTESNGKTYGVFSAPVVKA